MMKKMVARRPRANGPSMKTLVLLVGVSVLVRTRASFVVESPPGSGGRGGRLSMTRGGGWLSNPAAPVNTPSSVEKTLREALGKGPVKRLSLLGSTGSIGTQTLDIVRACPANFAVEALSAGTNARLLAEQVVGFHPRVVSMATPEAAGQLADILKSQHGYHRTHAMPRILHGEEGILAAATCSTADTVVTGIVGAAGLRPTIEAIKADKDIALANKETLISGGPVILPLLQQHPAVNMLPADSEHSAIFQCLQGLPPGALRRIVLTASGGAFRDFTLHDLQDWCRNDPSAVQKKATTHPNWDMGAKITLDSATMMNKGLEVIEAHYLFGASYDDIDIVVHPQSIVHSMIETQDTSCLAQLGWADMRLPLLYALSWPHRIKMDYPRLDLAKVGTLSFDKPDEHKYPCIGLAYEAGRIGGTMTAVLNAANEHANELYRNGSGGLGFYDIPKLIEGAMEAHREDGGLKVGEGVVTLEDILDSDQLARKYVERIVSSGDLKSGEKILSV